MTPDLCPVTLGRAGVAERAEGMCPLLTLVPRQTPVMGLCYLHSALPTLLQQDQAGAMGVASWGQRRTGAPWQVALPCPRSQHGMICMPESSHLWHCATGPAQAPWGAASQPPAPAESEGLCVCAHLWCVCPCICRVRMCVSAYGACMHEREHV